MTAFGDSGAAQDAAADSTQHDYSHIQKSDFGAATLARPMPASIIRTMEQQSPVAAELTRLTEPLSAQSPCGRSLDDSQTLAELESYRVFGRLKAAADEPNWQALRKSCLDALAASKDLRVLAYLTAAALRVEPLTVVLQLVPLIATWLDRFWAEVHPRVDEDAVARRNALMFFVDRPGVLDALRRATVVHDDRLGSFAVRDFEIATGVLRLTDPQAEPVSKDVIESALVAADPHQLRELSDLAGAAAAALTRVERSCSKRAAALKRSRSSTAWVRYYNACSRCSSPMQRRRCDYRGRALPHPKRVLVPANRYDLPERYRMLEWSHRARTCNGHSMR